MNNKILTFGLLIATIIYNQTYASSSLKLSNNTSETEKQKVLTEYFEMNNKDKQELMNIDEDYNLEEESKKIIKEILYSEDKNGEYNNVQLDFCYDCKQIVPFMSLKEIAAKYNLEMQEAIELYRNKVYTNDIQSIDDKNPSKKIFFGEIIDYIDEGHHNILDAAKNYNIGIRFIDDIYSKVVHKNSEGQYISNEEILCYIANRKIEVYKDENNQLVMRNRKQHGNILSIIARHFKLNQNIISNIIRKVSVLNKENEYVTYFDILNKLDDSKKLLQTIANELNLDINTVKQVYGRGTVLRGICDKIVRQDIIDYLYNGYNPHTMLDTIKYFCRNQCEKNILLNEILEISQRYWKANNSINRNLSDIIHGIHNDVINCIQKNNKLSLQEIANKYKITFKITEEIFKRTIIENNNYTNNKYNKTILIDDILNAHLYNTDKQYTIDETINKICSNEKLLTDTSYILNEDFKIIKVSDIKNKIVQDSKNNKLNLKNIASIYNISLKITDIIFRTLMINNNTNYQIFVGEILNYFSNFLSYVLSNVNQGFNQIHNDENFFTKFIICDTAMKFNINPDTIKSIISHYNTLF